MMVPTPDSTFHLDDHRDNGRRRDDGCGEYGDRDDVDAGDRCHNRSLGGRIGRVTMATLSQQRTTAATTPMQKREIMRVIFWRSCCVNFEGISGG